jgi:hypothetical protein
MAHICLDCSFKGTRFPQGACPACGSRNISSGEKDTQAKPPSRWSLFVLFALWAYLFYAIAMKLLVD